MRCLFSIAITVLFLTDVFGFDPSNQDDSAALARHFVERPNRVESPIQQGSFEPLDGETVTLMGGSTVRRMQNYGFFEAMLQSAFPEKKLHVRNIGWPADTVYRQQRPMFFYTEEGDTREGSIPDQRSKIEPGTFILMFGRMESLDGMAALPEFEAAYESLLEKLRKSSNRIVLVEPIPFVEAGPASDLAGERQTVLEAYSKKIEALAGKNGAVFVSLKNFDTEDFFPDGIGLSETGFRKLANQIADGLGFEASFDEEIVDAIQKKNHLWNQYYRPTNWAFLFGDRQWVPSSRGYENSENRWFVDEMAKLPEMIKDAEETIWEVAR